MTVAALSIVNATRFVVAGLARPGPPIRRSSRCLVRQGTSRSVHERGE